MPLYMRKLGVVGVSSLPVLFLIVPNLQNFSNVTSQFFSSEQDDNPCL